MRITPYAVGLLLASLTVLSGCGAPSVEVRGSADTERIEAYEAMTLTALAQVEDLWGQDSVARPVEVVLPATTAEFEELTGNSGSAVPATTVGSMEQAHVVVHPDSWGLLTPEGRQAVLTHEVTHLSQQGDGPVPAWLGEGLAEYTAHRHSQTPPATIAGSALEDVHAGALPTAWPDPAGSAEAWDGYALAWLACLYIAQTWSEEALVELYDSVSGGTAVSEAFPAVLDVTEAEALAGWGPWLRELGG